MKNHTFTYEQKETNWKESRENIKMVKSQDLLIYKEKLKAELLIHYSSKRSCVVYSLAKSQNQA